MLVELWDLEVLTLVEILGSFWAGACPMQFAGEFCAAAVTGWTSWTRGSPAFGAEDCSIASAR